MFPESPEMDRREWTIPRRVRGRILEIDLAHLDSSDPDDRHVLILAEHPELVRAIEQNLDEVEVGGLRFNPSLHLTLHEIVANQLWDDDPPEMWRTARRLLSLGYKRHEVLHMLASIVSAEIWEALREGQPYDADRYRTALAALPGPWEAQRQP